MYTFKEYCLKEGWFGSQQPQPQQQQPQQQQPNHSNPTTATQPQQQQPQQQQPQSSVVEQDFNTINSIIGNIKMPGLKQKLQQMLNDLNAMLRNN